MCINIARKTWYPRTPLKLTPGPDIVSLINVNWGPLHSGCSGLIILISEIPIPSGSSIYRTLRHSAFKNTHKQNEWQRVACNSQHFRNCQKLEQISRCTGAPIFTRHCTTSFPKHTKPQRMAKTGLSFTKRSQRIGVGNCNPFANNTRTHESHMQQAPASIQGCPYCF